MGLRNSKQSMEITAAAGVEKKNGHVNGKAGHEEVNEEKITMNGDADKIIPNGDTVNGDLAEKLKAVDLVEEEKKDTEPENENKEKDADADAENENADNTANKENNETKEQAEDKKTSSIKTKVKNLKNRSLSFLKKKPKAADTTQDGATAEAAAEGEAKAEAAATETDVPAEEKPETTEKTEEATPEVKEVQEVPAVPETVEEPKVEAESSTEVVAETKRDD